MFAVLTRHPPVLSFFKVDYYRPGGFRFHRKGAQAPPPALLPRPVRPPHARRRPGRPDLVDAVEVTVKKSPLTAPSIVNTLALGVDRARLAQCDFCHASDALVYVGPEVERGSGNGNRAGNGNRNGNGRGNDGGGARAPRRNLQEGRRASGVAKHEAQVAQRRRRRNVAALSGGDDDDKPKETGEAQRFGGGRRRAAAPGDLATVGEPQGASNSRPQGRQSLVEEF